MRNKFWKRDNAENCIILTLNGLHQCDQIGRLLYEEVLTPLTPKLHNSLTPELGSGVEELQS